MYIAFVVAILLSLFGALYVTLFANRDAADRPATTALGEQMLAWHAGALAYAAATPAVGTTTASPATISRANVSTTGIFTGTTYRFMDSTVTNPWTSYVYCPTITCPPNQRHVVTFIAPGSDAQAPVADGFTLRQILSQLQQAGNNAPGIGIVGSVTAGAVVSYVYGTSGAAPTAITYLVPTAPGSTPAVAAGSVAVVSVTR